MESASGIAISAYRPNMEIKEIPVDLRRLWPIRMGRVSPMIMKLAMLKIAPRINPLPRGLNASMKQIIATTTVIVSASEQYFFSVSLIASNVLIGPVVSIKGLYHPEIGDNDPVNNFFDSFFV